MIRGIINHLRQRLSPRTILSEVGAAGMRAASQGAAEVAQALYGQSHAYVPYGPTEKPLPVQQPEANVHGTGREQTHAQALEQARQRAANQQQDRGRER